MESHLPDEVIARRAAAGNLNCFEALLARYRERVYRLCFQMAGNAEDAEDWAQESFVRVYRQLGHYNPERPFAPWLLRVVANACLNLAKARTRRAARLKLGLTPDRHPGKAAPDPTRTAIDEEAWEAARMALETLSPLLRQAFVLWAEEDLTFRELADTLGVPLTTAAQRVRRALAQLRQRVTESGFEVTP